MRISLGWILVFVTTSLCNGPDVASGDDGKAYGADVHWLQDLDRGFEEARESGKPLLIVFR